MTMSTSSSINGRVCSHCAFYRRKLCWSKCLALISRNAIGAKAKGLRLVLRASGRAPTSFRPTNAASSKPQCPSALPTTSLAHAGQLYGRPQSYRALHPPGPLATFQGSAQVTGLLKERSQDYFLAATDIAFDGGYYCSQTSWTDSEVAADGCDAVPNGNGCGTAAGCSTTGSGTGVVSSTPAADAPSIVVTGVFDGHGGEMSARYAQQAILSYVASDRELHSSLGSGDVKATGAALRGIFRRVDSELLSLAASAAPPPPSAPSFPPPGDFHDGTTALVTLQLGGLLAVANAGDSRAVLCRRGEAVRLSRDHTPALRSERERIEAAGGQVLVARGAARVVVPLAGKKDVLQALSVSRSLGDPDFKVHGMVISDPDVSVVPLLPGEDSFLIAASDGLWGRVSDQEAVDCAAEVLAEYSSMSAPNRAAAAKAAARRLLRLALDQGSVDDVTVVVSVFAWA